MTAMTAEAISAYLTQAFPEVDTPRIVSADERQATLAMAVQKAHLRPGGTVSGPTLMALADTAMYALVLASVGIAVPAVTTQLSMTFLRRPKPGSLVAEATWLKRGKSLAVGAVHLHVEGDSEPCAHAVVTYALQSS